MIQQTSRDHLVYDQIWRAEGIGVPDNTAVQMIDELAGRPGEAAARVADLGCGTGRHVLYAARRGLHVTGIDHSETALGLLRPAALGLDCEIVLGDAFAWVSRQTPSSLDGIICVDSIHHTSSDPQAVEQIARGLAERVKPGGQVLITMLCNIRYSTGETPPGRLLVSLDRGTDLLDHAFTGHRVITEEHSPVRIPHTVSQDPASGALVRASYSAERLLRLYSIGEASH